jgi:hypothetical protein
VPTALGGAGVGWAVGWLLMDVPQWRQKFIPGWFSPPHPGQMRAGNPDAPGGVIPGGGPAGPGAGGSGVDGTG